MNWCYCASGRFGSQVLSKAVQEGLLPDLVITIPDRIMGRKLEKKPVPVKQFCVENSIAVMQVSEKKELADALRKFDMSVVCDFGIILSNRALEFSRCINIHPSLLPRWRGPAPIFWTILSEDVEAGVSIIDMAEKVDSGPILLQEAIKIEREYYSSLSDKLAQLSVQMLKHILLRINALHPREQDEKMATYARFVSKKDAMIDFAVDDVFAIDRKVRAFDASYGATMFLGNKRFKIFKAEPVFEENIAPEKLAIEGKQLFLGAKNGALRLFEVQIEGKRRMSAEEFVNGYSDYVING